MQAQAATLKQVGRGGLNEKANEDKGSASALDPGRRDQAISVTEIIRRPSEVEEVLRLLSQQLKALKNLPAVAGEPLSAPLCSCPSLGMCSFSIPWSISPGSIILSTRNAEANRKSQNLKTQNWALCSLFLSYVWEG